MTSLTQICLQKNKKIIETKCTNTIRTKLSTHAIILSKDFQPLPDTLFYLGGWVKIEIVIENHVC